MRWYSTGSVADAKNVPTWEKSSKIHLHFGAAVKSDKSEGFGQIAYSTQRIPMFKGHIK